MSDSTTATDKQVLINDRLAAATGGTLHEFLTEVVASGRSFNDAAFELRRLTGVKVTPQAVRLWVRDIRREAS